MKKVVILSAGPGLSEIVEKYGHSSDWIPSLLSAYKLEFIVKKTYLKDALSINDGDLFIITGSKYSVYDNNDWIAQLLHFVKLLILSFIIYCWLKLFSKNRNQFPPIIFVIS